jgi:hypothetical protein
VGGIKQFTDNNDTKIMGDTDDTLIGNVGDRLKVEAVLGATPSDTVMYHENFARDTGGAKDLNVDGSTTTQTFTVGPQEYGDSRDWYVDHMTLQIDDLGNVTMDSFGAISGGLTNGLKIKFVVNGITHTFATIKDNRDIVAIFSNEGTLQNTGSGFIQGNFFAGGIGFIEPKMVLQESTNDRIYVEVQDDLTGLVELRIGIHYYHIV